MTARPLVAGRARARRPLSVLVPTVVTALVGTALALGVPLPAHAASSGLVITEVFGGNGATNLYNQDFVEIHNRSGSAISLDGKSVQYRSASGASAPSGVVALSGLLPAGGYYLVGLASATGGTALPVTPDLTSGAINLSGTSGTVILANKGTALTATELPVGDVATNGATNVIDLLGYGTSNTYEGVVRSGAPSNTTTAKRTNPEADGDNNSTDFAGSAPGTPQNCDCVAPAALKITEIYTEGGTDAAGFDHDFVELQNTGSSALSMAGLSLQYRAAGATGAATKVLDLSGTMASGSFDVIQLGTSGTAGAVVPFDAAYDASATGPDLHSTGGTLFVAKSTSDYDPGTGAVTADQFRGDLVGWGASNTFETAAADSSALTATTSLSRANGGSDSDDNSADLTVMTPTPNASPAIPVRTIPEIQGTGATTPFPGANVQVTGVVTAAYPNTTGGFNGFYLETPGHDPANDATPDASDGIFVYTGSSATFPTPKVGDEVTVTNAKVSEFAGMTELTATNPANLANSGPAPAADVVVPARVLPGTACALPGDGCLQGAALEAAREAHEGELYAPTAPFTVSDAYDGSPWSQPSGESFKMKGEIGLAANDDKALMSPTEVANPKSDPAGIAARTAYNAAHMVTLDDGNGVDFASTTGSPFPWFTGPTTGPRVGAAVTFTKAFVFDYRNNLWKLQPQSQVAPGTDGSAQGVTFDQARPAAPEPVGGNVRIATFNMLNYFTDDAQTWVSTGGDAYQGTDRKCTYYTDRASARITANTCTWTDGRGVVAPAVPVKDGAPGPRGAATQESLGRQQAKEIAAINTMDADVMSLEEIENAIKLGYADRDRAVTHLVDVLNQDWEARHPGDISANGPRWAFAASPRPEAQPTLREQDAIRSAFIFNPRVVQTVGRSEILVNSAPFSNAREPLAQAFMRVGGSRDDGFIVVVNHFKSKGSSTETGDNVDLGDGAGAWNGDRIRQAKALDAFARSVSEDKGIPAVFMTGDYNAYSHEDPILTLENAGWHELAPDNHQKTYSFGGLMGSLDHVFANDAAAQMVTGQTVWPINANESVFYEYSRFNYNVTNLFDGTLPFRASDHNPEIIGVNAPLNPPPADMDTVQVLASNDFHGRLEDDPASASAGAASMAESVKELRQQNPNTVFAMAGDIIGASTFASFIQYDKPTLDAMNQAGLEVSAAGNHEFDKGYNDLVNRVMKPFDADTNKYGGANWPYLAANIRLKSDNSYALASDRTDHGYDHSNGATWWKTMQDGKTVGFVGAVTEDLPSLVSPDAISALKITSIVDEVNASADQLKSTGCGGSGCDLVIELVHEGAATPDCSAIADPNTTFGHIVVGADANVDAIVSGHTHLKYNCKVAVPDWSAGAVTKRPVVSAGQYGSYLNQLEFDFSPGTHNLVDVRQHVLQMKDYEADQATADIVTAAVAYADQAGQQVLGSETGPFQRARRLDSTTSTVVENRGGESTLGNLVAEIQRWKTGAQIGFMNPGGLRADLFGTNPGVDPSDITYRQAADVQPFANTLMTVDMTGAQVKTLLEQQWQRDPDGNVPSRPFLRLGTSEGFQFSYDSTRPEGDRITGIWLSGTALDPQATYKVSASNFLIAGGDNFRAFIGGRNKQDTGNTDLQATVDYLAAHPAVSPEFGQHAVGVQVTTPPVGGFAVGDEVTVQVSSLAMTGDQVRPDIQDAQVTLSDGATELATAPVDNALRSDPYDEAGTTTVTFTVPPGVAGPTTTFTLKGNNTGTSFPVVIPTHDSRVATTVTGTAADVTYGQAGSVQVTVTPSAATGVVELFDGTTSLGSAAVTAGSAAVALAAKSLEPGAHDLRLVFTPTAGTGYAPAEGTVTVAVTKADVAVNVTADPADPDTGEAITLTVTVDAAGAFVPTGQVQAFDGDVALGDPATLANGMATITVPGFPASGPKQLRVHYAGDGHATAADGTVSLTVKGKATSVAATADPIAYGAEGTVTATVTPTAAAGSVRLLNGSEVLSTGTVTGGAASLAVPAKSLEPGVQTLVVEYVGNSEWAPSQTTVTVTVTKASATVSLSLTPGTVKVKHGTVAATAKVTATGVDPSGSVEFLVDGVVVKTVGLVSGNASAVLGPFASVGTRSVTARYVGDAHVAGATSAASTVVVTKQQPKLTVQKPRTAHAGKAFRLVVTIAAQGFVPTGKVTVKVKGAVAKTVTLRNGKAVVKFKVRKAGRHAVRVRYAGDANTLAATKSLHVRVKR